MQQSAGLDGHIQSNQIGYDLDVLRKESQYKWKYWMPRLLRVREGLLG
jgi:hypothetical protein